MSEFTHLDANGNVKMVDVGQKKKQLRIATASGRIELKEDTVSTIKANDIAKGNVLGVAKVAAIQAAKQTSSLIPLCHNIFLSQIEVSFEIGNTYIDCQAEVRSVDVTGVEMEALTAVTVGLLTIYDMCKAVDKTMVLNQVVLKKKEKIDV
jgi:cyclic pyranopterin monophosphate synthase